MSLPGNDADDQLLGTFELDTIQDLIRAFKKQSIPYSLGDDQVFGHQQERVYGGNVRGPEISIFVPSSRFAEAQTIANNLYPI